MTYFCRTDISEQKENEDHAKQKAALVESVNEQRQKAAQHERNFKQMAELAPCGELTYLQFRFSNILSTDTRKVCLHLTPSVKLLGRILSVRRTRIQSPRENFKLDILTY